MSKGIIGVDVDLTVADSDLSHWNWLQQVSRDGDGLCMPNGSSTDLLNYDLGSYFDLPNHLDSMDFWRLSDIYDERPEETPLYITKQIHGRTIQPIKNSVQCLQSLSSQGWEIVFVSHVKGAHHKSKVEWLKRHFPFMDGFIATQEKHYVNCDIFIDDRQNHLNKSSAEYKIKFDTVYEQDIELKYVDLISNDWVEIEEFNNKLIEG